mgnify:CR=1 FL=1
MHFISLPSSHRMPDNGYSGKWFYLRGKSVCHNVYKVIFGVVHRKPLFAPPMSRTSQTRYYLILGYTRYEDSITGHPTSIHPISFGTTRDALCEDMHRIPIMETQSIVIYLFRRFWRTLPLPQLYIIHRIVDRDNWQTIILCHESVRPVNSVFSYHFVGNRAPVGCAGGKQTKKHKQSSLN